MHVVSYIYKRTVSSILIVTIMLSQVVIMDPIVDAADATKDTMGLVVILAAEELLKDKSTDNGLITDKNKEDMKPAGGCVQPSGEALRNMSCILSDASLNSDLQAIGVSDMLGDSIPTTVSGRILRYADDIQKQLQNTKVMIVPVRTMDKPEEPWKIQEVLDKLYTEGDITDNKIAKLQGVVMIGDIPLPLVTKDARTFLSVYPYTDFEDPAYYYDQAKGQFVYNERAGTLKAEVWHGVIRYPVSWQQYLMDEKQAQVLSAAKMKDTTGEEYNKTVEKMKLDYMALQRKELSTYFDKNHSYYIGGEYSEFSKKAIQMDLFRELGQVTQSSLQGYQEFIENWDNVSYMRYTKKWLQELTDKFYPKSKDDLNAIGKVPTENANVPASDPTKKDVFATAKSLASQFESTGNKTQNLIPDIFTKDTIDKFLSRSTDVFGFLTNSYMAYFNGTGRWDFQGNLKARDATSIFKIIGQIDQTAQKNIRSVNDSMEKVLDEMLDKYQNDKNLMLDMPSGEVNYFGKFLQAIRMTRPHPYLDVDPAPEWSNNYLGNVGTGKIRFTTDQIDVNAKKEKDTTRSKYIPFTGQDFDEVVVHVEKDPRAQYKLSGYNGYEGGSVKGNNGSANPNGDNPYVYYNPNATQEKYIEYTDDIKSPDFFAQLSAIWQARTGKIDGETVTKASYRPYRKATLHLINKPFTAQDCTIFVGGAPEGGLFVRGEESTQAPNVEGWTEKNKKEWTNPDTGKQGNPGGSGWRDEKVEAQGAFEIAPLQAAIDNLKPEPEPQPPAGATNWKAPCPSNMQKYTWEKTRQQIELEKVKLASSRTWLKYYNVAVDPVTIAKDFLQKQYNIEKATATLARDKARDTENCNEKPNADTLKSIEDKYNQDESTALAKQISNEASEKEFWDDYMKSEQRGDEARFKDFIDFAKRLPQETAQTVEANKLYNVASDAYMEYGKDDGSELKKRPETEYYEELNPDGTGGWDLFGGVNSKDPVHGNDDSGWKSGFFGDCTAPNLQFNDAGDALPPDASVAKGKLTATIEQARFNKTNIASSVFNFVTNLLSLGTKDALSKGSLQQGILMRMNLAPADITWKKFNAKGNKISSIDRVVALLRTSSNPKDKVKVFEDPGDFAISDAALDLVEDASYDPKPKSSDPLDQMVAAYRALPDNDSSKQARNDILLSVVQLAVSQSKYDPSDEDNKKYACQPMKALVPIKDVAGAKSVESPSYQPLKATKVVEREDRTNPVGTNYIMGPDAPHGKPLPQMTEVAETYTGKTSSLMLTPTLTKALNAIQNKSNEAWANYEKKYQDLLKGSVKAFFSSSVFSVAPQAEVKSSVPYREQAQTQNRYGISPVSEKIIPETSYKACLMYANYGIPLTVAEQQVRDSITQDVNKLKDKKSAYIPKHYGSTEQLPPAIERYIGGGKGRTWIEILLGAPTEIITSYLAPMIQVPNAEEQLGLDKKQKIVSIIKHKEPTNETIAKQLKNSTSFDLPVDSPRYVDMFHYDPIPHWESVSDDVSDISSKRIFCKSNPASGEKTIKTISGNDCVEDKNAKLEEGDSWYSDTPKDWYTDGVQDVTTSTTYSAKITGWSEYYEHVRFPYLDWFNVFDKDTRFAYVTENDRSTVTNTLKDITRKTQDIARSFNQYINDYLAQTSLSGGASENRDTLKGMSFDYNKALKQSDLVADVSDDKKVSVAEQRVSFAIYWQHLSMAEKYKYVLHNYLSSDSSLSQGDAPKVDPGYFLGTDNKTKTGFEAGTVIAESAYPNAIPLALENLSYTKEQKPSLAMPDPVPVKIEDDTVKTCKKGYYSPSGVPLFNFSGSGLNWFEVITDCWWPSVNPPVTFSNNNENFASFLSRITTETVDKVGDVASDVGSGKNAVDVFKENAPEAADGLGKIGKDFVDFGTSVKDLALTAGKVGESIGNTFQDTDGDGLPAVGVGTPSDPDLFSGDSLQRVSVNGVSKIMPGSNGFKDVQDFVDKITYKIGDRENVKKAIISTKSIEPMTVEAVLKTKEGLLLPGDSFDYVEIELDDNAKSMMTVSNAEKIQKVEKGSATFHIYPVYGINKEGRIRFHVVRQKISNSDQQPERVNPDIVSDWLTLKSTSDSLSVAYLYIPTKENGRHSFSEGAVFTTDDKVHTLAMSAVNEQGATLDKKSGEVKVTYKKEDPSTGEFKSFENNSLKPRIALGKNAVGVSIPTEAGKYLVEFTPEDALELPPTKTTFLVMESKIASVDMKLSPSVLVEGGSTTAFFSFLDSKKQEVLVSDQLAQFVVPTTPAIPIDVVSADKIDGYPENKTQDDNPIDFLVGKVGQVTLTAGDMPEGSPDFVEIPLRLQISDSVQKSLPLRVYKKGTLQAKVTVRDKKESYSVMDNAQIVADVEINDTAGNKVPYTGTLSIGYSDKGFFEKASDKFTVTDGKGVITLNPAHRSGEVHLTVTDPAESFQAQDLPLKFNSGPLAKVHFTSPVERPLEPQTQDTKLGKDATEMKLFYQGEDTYGNVVDTNDQILFELSPFEGLEMYEVNADGSNGAKLAQQSLNNKKYYGQLLTKGKGQVNVKSTTYTGEVTIVLAAQAATTITKDSLRIPVRFTLYKEFIQRLKPNILYTNLLGGNYGDVTKKDFMAGWWLLSGKSQAVTASTISSYQDPVAVRVQPNGTISVPGGDGLSANKAVVPIFNQGDPFQLEVRNRDNNKALMRVRYNIAPLPVKEITALNQIETTPGLYLMKSENTEITRQDDKKQSIITNNEKEVGILGDNLQFLPTNEPPEIDVNTERKDLLEMHMKTADGADVMDMFAVLPVQSIYETAGGSSTDIDAGKMKKEFDDYESKASTGQSNITYNDALQNATKTLAEKKIITPVEDKDRYVNKIIVSRAEIDSYKGGTFLEASTTPLYTMVNGNIVLAGIDTILNPNNVQASVVSTNISASQKSQPFIKLQTASGGIVSTYGLQDVNRTERVRNLFDVKQKFRSENIKTGALPKDIVPGLFADMTLAKAVSTSDKVDTEILSDRIRLKKTFVTTIPASQNGNINTPARTEQEEVTAAEVYTDGSYSLADARFAVTRRFAANIVKYTITEKNSNKTLGVITLVLDPSVLRVLPYAEGTTLLYSSKEQGVYVEMKDTGSSFNEANGEIVKGDTQVLSLSPEHFMEATESGYGLSVKDPTNLNLNTPNPLVLQLKDSKSLLLADLYIQLTESPFEFTSTKDDVVSSEDLKGIVSTALDVEKAAGEVRIKDADGKVLWAFDEATFENRVLPTSPWMVTPDQLGPDMYTYVLKQGNDIKAKVSFKLSSHFVTFREARTPEYAIPATYIRKTDPYVHLTKDTTGMLTGFELKEFTTAFDFTKPTDFLGKSLSITSRNLYGANFSYRDGHGVMGFTLSDKNNPSTKKTLLETTGSFAPQALPMKLYNGENTTGIYFASATVQNSALANGYALERRIDGEDRAYWKIKKDDTGNVIEEKNIAEISRDGSVSLKDTDFEWRSTYAQGNYQVSLFEKSTNTLLDSISMLLKPGTITRVMPWKDGNTTLYNPAYQGVYTQMTSNDYYFDSDLLSIRRKNLSKDEVLSFKKDTFFTLTGNQNLQLVPSTTVLNQVGKILPPSVNLMDSDGNQIAVIAVSFNEQAPRISIKQQPEATARVATDAGSAVLSTLSNDVSVKDNGDTLQIMRTNGTNTQILWTISKADVSAGTSDSALVDIKPSAFSADGLYLTLLPKGETDDAKALAVLSYKAHKAYGPMKFFGKTAFGEALKRPGVYIREVDPLVTLVADPTLFTQKIGFGYDDVFVMTPNGVITSSNPNIFTTAVPGTQPIPSSALFFSLNAFGIDIAHEFYKFTNLPLSSVKMPQRLLSKGIDTILPTNGNVVTLVDYKQWGTLTKGVDMISDTLGHTVSAAFEGLPIIQWTSTFVPTLLANTKLVYDPSMTRGLFFTVTKENGEKIFSYALTPNFVEKATPVSITTTSDTNQAITSSDPVRAAAELAAQKNEERQKALDLLGAHGVFVQKMVNESYFSIGYEATGASTNNPYALVLKDQTLSTSKTGTAGNTGIGVEDALTDSGSGAGWTGDFKNMVLFAAGNSVGKSTLPHMSEALINLGDPVISLKIDRADNRTNDQFTNDVGEFIMEHANAGINTIKVFDIDGDGRKDILFAEKTGKIFGVKNMGGNPVMWKYLGQIFDVPDGIKKLLVTKLDDDDKPDLMISTGKSNIISSNDSVAKAMSYVEGSIVSLKNLGGGIYQRGVNAIKDLGKVSDMQMGDFDGNGTDDLFALTDKNELKVVLISPKLSDGSTPPYQIITLDTLGIALTKKELAPEDVYVRFHDTQLFDQADAPTSMPALPEVVFVPTVEGQGVTNASNLSKNDPGTEDYTSLVNNTQTAFRSVDGLRNQTVKMLVRSDEPYVRSGGQKKAILEDIMYKMKKLDPFSFMNEGIIGILNPVNTIQQINLTNELENTRTEFSISKKGTDLNGGKVRKGDKIKYEVSAELPEISDIPEPDRIKELKDFELADRIPLSMNLLPGSVTCEIQEKGKTTWKVLALQDQCVLSNTSGGNLFNLYFKGLALKNGEKLRISYQTEVMEDPITYHLNLLKYGDAMAALAAQAGVNIKNGLGSVGANLVLGDKANRMGASVTSESFGGKGAFYYNYKEATPLFEKNFIKNSSQKPGAGNPIMEELMTLMGYTYNDDGNLVQEDPEKEPDQDKIKDFAKSLGKTMQTATSTDKDEDGVPDLWDNEVDTKPEYKNQNISAASDLDIGGNIDKGTKGFSNALDQVNKRLSENNCYFGGCGLFPKNKAFLVPGQSELFEGPDIPVFAFPTPSGVVPVWPPDGSYFGSKSVAQIRVYFSMTLSARMAMAICVAPFDYGTANTSFLFGIIPVLPNANCYPFILPDVFNLVELCKSLESALSGVVTAATDIVGGGGAYAAARVTKRALSGAGSDPDGAFVAYHYDFSDPALAPNIIEQLQGLGRNSGTTNRSYNKHSGGFPKIPMDWAERQMNEFLKLLKIPTIYIRLPDPRSLIGNVVKNAEIMAKSSLDGTREKEQKKREEDLKKDNKSALEQKAKQLGIGDENTPDGTLKTLVMNSETQKILDAVANMDSATLTRKATELGISGGGVLKEDALRTQVKDKMVSAAQTKVNAMNRAALLSDAKTKLLITFAGISDDQLRSVIASKQQANNAANKERCLTKIQNKANAQTDVNDGTVQNMQVTNIADAVSKKLQELGSGRQYLNTILDTAQGDISCEGDYIAAQMQQVLGDESAYKEMYDTFTDPSFFNSLLMKQQGIGDALEFLSKIPLLNISHEEVVFDFPWIAPEKFFEMKQNVQYALDQSIQNFQNFYKANADCFFDDPSTYNTISEPTFSISAQVEGTGTPRIPTADVNGKVSPGANMKLRCLAAARIGGDAWGNIQGLQKNIDRLNQYANVQEKFKKYVQWKSYTVGRLVEATTGIIDFFSGYITRQQQILNNWKKAVYQIKNYSKTFQVVVDVFQNYRNSCADCVNDKGSALASVLDGLGNIIPDIPVLRVPRWPDIIVDFSSIRAQMRITIPDIKLSPIDFQMPKLSPITFPNISVEGALSEQDLSFMASNGLNVRFPVLPALPDLPDLPEFPQFDLPKIADLPPPPTIPKLDVTITTTIQIVDKILQNICLVRKNIVPVPEGQLAAQIEKLTRGTTLSKVKENKHSDIVLPQIDQIRLSGSIRLINNKPFTGITDAVKEIAKFWNDSVIGSMTNFVSGAENTASNAVGNMLSNLNNAMKGPDGLTDTERFAKNIQDAMAEGNKGVNAAGNFIQQKGSDFANTLSGGTKISSTEGAGSSYSTEELKQNIQIATAMQSPEVQNLFTQMNALQTLMESATDADGISFENYIPSLKAQVELLKTSGDTLGEAKNAAIEKIEGIIALAEKEGKVLEEDAPISADSYEGIRTLKATRDQLNTLKKNLDKAQYTVDYISSAKTLDEFTSTLRNTGMFADTPRSTITASTDGVLQTAQERNAEQQRNLEAIVKNATAIVPIDYAHMMAPAVSSDQKTVSDTYDIPASGAWTSDTTPLPQTSGGTSTLIAANDPPTGGSGTSTTIAVSNTADPTYSDTSSNLVVQLNDTAGSFVSIMNYSGGNDEDSGLDSAEDLNGDGQRDIVYYQGRDLYIKYNVLNQATGNNLGSGKAIYTGSKRIYVKTLNTLLPFNPRVQNFRAIEQNSRQAIIGFSEQVRGSENPAMPSVYALRFHITADAWLTDSLAAREATQCNYMEYYIYASPETTYTMDASRVPALEAELKVSDQKAKEGLLKGCQETVKSDKPNENDPGTPLSRVIVVKKSPDMQATLSFEKSGIPYSTTIAPFDPATKSYGTFTTPILLHPQKEQDTVAPSITLEQGSYMTVPTGLKDGLEIKAHANDPSDIATMYWDKDTETDSDQDGDATNDHDVVCSDPKNPQVAPCTFTKKTDGTIEVNAPLFKLAPFSDDQIGKKFYMRLFAVDTVGNVAVKDVTVEPRATNVVVDNYDILSGVVEGHIDPPSEGLELRVMRMRSDKDGKSTVSELPLPTTIKTGVGGTFRIEGIYAKESLGILNSSNTQVAEVTKTGSIQVSDQYKGKNLDVLIGNGASMIRKLFSTEALKVSTPVKTAETTFNESYLNNQGNAPTNEVQLQIFDKTKLRLQTEDGIQKVQIIQGDTWNSLYEFKRTSETTLQMVQGSAWNQSFIGGQTIQKNGIYISMLLITVEGKAVGLLTVPLTSDNQMFDVK